MIDVILHDYIESELQTVPVFMEQPTNPPDEYVILRMMDVGRRNKIDAATFDVLIRAESLYRTALLRDRVKEILFDAITLDSISSSELGGGQLQVETANHVYQAELIFNFYYYEED